MGKQTRRLEEIDAAMASTSEGAGPLCWHSPMSEPFRLSGFPWIARDRVYRRLPVSPEWSIPANVDILANHTAGGQLRFRTRSAKLCLRVELADPAGMYHMPATGQCGFDCYLGEEGRQLYCATARFDPRATGYECSLFELERGPLRSVTLDFPLYQGVQSVSVGLETDAEVLVPLPYRLPGKVIFYGTSITQGGCATRPGMAYTNILSRRLGMECVNLGFSGSGKGEPELAHVIAGIDEPACFVLDYEGNADKEGLLEKTLREFIAILRRSHPLVPILVLSKTLHSKEIHDPVSLARFRALRDFQRGVVEELRRAGDAYIRFADGGSLCGPDSHECTVDGVHPNDLGFWLMASGLEPVLREMLSASLPVGASD